MTKKKETLPTRSFSINDEKEERMEVSFTLTAILEGDVCSKDAAMNDLRDLLVDRANDSEYDDVKIKSFTLTMTAFKPIK